MLQLAQQATLETRDAKHEPRTLAEQRAVWRDEAAETLGGPDAVDAMMQPALHPLVRDQPADGRGLGDGDGGSGARRGGGTPFDLAELACPRRSTTPNPGRPGSHRQARAAGRAARRRGAAALRSIRLDSAPTTASRNRRRCGGPTAQSVYTVAGCRAVHLGPDPRRRAAARRHRGPHRRPRRGRLSRWSWRCWSRPRTGSP